MRFKMTVKPARLSYIQREAVKGLIAVRSFDLQGVQPGRTARLLWASRVVFAVPAVGPLTLRRQTCRLAIDPLALSGSIGLTTHPRDLHPRPRQRVLGAIGVSATSDNHRSLVDPDGTRTILAKERGIPERYLIRVSTETVRYICDDDCRIDDNPREEQATAST